MRKQKTEVKNQKIFFKSFFPGISFNSWTALTFFILILCFNSTAYPASYSSAANLEESKLMEEKAVIKEKIESALRLKLDPKNFYTSVHIIADPEGNKAKQVYITAIVNKQAILKLPAVQTLPNKFKETYLLDFQQDLESEISGFLGENKDLAGIKISFINFELPVINKNTSLTTSTSMPHDEQSIIFFTLAAGIISLLLTAYFLLHKMMKTKTSEPHFEEKKETVLNKIPLQRSFGIGDILDNASPQDLAKYLYSEPIRAVALILFHLPLERAAAITSQWPAERQALLIATLNEMQIENNETILKECFTILEIPFSKNQVKTDRNFTEKAVHIFERLPQTSQKMLLDKMLEKTPEAATKTYA